MRAAPEVQQARGPTAVPLLEQRRRLQGGALVVIEKVAPPANGDAERFRSKVQRKSEKRGARFIKLEGGEWHFRVESFC